MTTRRVPPRSVFRDILAFSRAVERDGIVQISATGPTDADGALAADDAYGQTQDVLRQIEEALGELDMALADVTRMRIYLKEYGQLQDILKAQHAAFDATPPACSVVCVAAFHVEGMHVYIEADAIRPRQGADAELW